MENTVNNVGNKAIFGKEETLSFEVFPPKKDDDFEKAFDVLDRLGALKPDFISVTFGAGGSRAGKTAEIASYIKNKLKLDAIAHLTCVGTKKDEIADVVKRFQEAGVNHILALRGDRPKDMTDEQFDRRDFAHASDLMAYLRDNTDIEYGGACYPEKHFESFSFESDLKNLKLKQDMGAKFFISQLFFDNDYYYNFLEKADKKGINVPIAAGIMPITTPNQIGTTITLSGSAIPKALSDIIAKYGEDAEEFRKAGIDFAARQIKDLKDNGVKHIHLYCMNKPKTTAEILESIERKNHV